MRYYLPDPWGFPSQLEKPGCGSLEDIQEAIVQNFPFEVTSSYTRESMEWLRKTFGENKQGVLVCPTTFEFIVTEIETDSRWCFAHGRTYRFKNLNDALLFKLTCGGT